MGSISVTFFCFSPFNPLCKLPKGMWHSSKLFNIFFFWVGKGEGLFLRFEFKLSCNLFKFFVIGRFAAIQYVLNIIICGSFIKRLYSSFIQIKQPRRAYKNLVLSCVAIDRENNILHNLILQQTQELFLKKVLTDYLQV